MRLHHVAYTTNDLDEKAAELTRVLGFEPIGPPVVDAVQKVRIQFMRMGTDSRLELLEPNGEKSPIARHLKAGGGLYHLCFEVDDLDGTLERMRDSGEAIVVCEPVPAPAIEGRRVAFVVTSGRDLIELLEASADEQG
jgi:methylmalonyl-CoA epimerase